MPALIIVTVMVTSCGPCINLTFQNSVLTLIEYLRTALTACTLSTNHMPNCMSVIESFQSSNRTVPDSTRSSIGEPEPISRNALDVVVIPSVAEPLTALPLLHYVFGDRVDKIYRIQGSLEFSFFRVIVIIRFRLTRNGIISVRSVNLIIIIIDGTVQHRRFIRNHLCYRCNMFGQSCCISIMCTWNILLLDRLEFNKNMNPFLR
ncbi:hypothetical protein M9H77_25912 [Catharanthus roseus]|uniref:Uncharacterized protein n=1 Tax=Catharanthus roseus TaxID=4058 RepID=A0ACC0AAA8_CATRO|nr:hypothetical protein M9H77_25912 [Catharanthus roseus]